MLRRVRATTAVAVLVALGAPSAQAAVPAPMETAFGGQVPCREVNGIRFCEGSTQRRVPTWDGVPLDLNLALPAKGRGPYPLVVIMHGWGGNKGSIKDLQDWARAGYAALSYSARGFGESCGSPESRRAFRDACRKGWVHLADIRFEARDTQHLAGVLADEGLVRPAIGVTGGSYGGGQSLQLAMLRDRVRLPDGSYAPWRSPRGTPMRIAAAVPVVPWSDLAAALVPNGRTLDYAVVPPRLIGSPVGVMKMTFVTGLFAAGSLTGNYAPAGADPGADLLSWYALTAAGDPYDENPVTARVVEELQANHSAYSMDLGGAPPAPTLISNGFTDDLFPVDEAVRWANRVRAEHPRATIAQLHFDYGHQRGQGKAADSALLKRETRAWMDRYVKRRRKAKTLRGVTVLTQTCPKAAPSGGPFTARSWHKLAGGEVRFAAAETRTIAPWAGDLRVGQAVDPISGPGACATTPSNDIAGAATYRLPAAAGSGFTMIGSPTVIGEMRALGAKAVLAARLWDVAPDGTQTLVARGTFRPETSGRQVFQLHPNAWHYAAGHVPKLELLTQDLPYARFGNLPTPVQVSGLELRLPVRERPGGSVLRRAAPVLPPGLALAPR